MKILLVEDSRSIGLENRRALVDAGYEVIWAEDGESALRLAREQTPDLILLDLLLPRIGGMDVLRSLKRDTGTCRIPVVVVSGLSEKNRQLLIETGADDYLEESVIMPDKGVNLLPGFWKMFCAGSGVREASAFPRRESERHEPLPESAWRLGRTSC